MTLFLWLILYSLNLINYEQTVVFQHYTKDLNFYETLALLFLRIDIFYGIVLFGMWFLYYQSKCLIFCFIAYSLAQFMIVALLIWPN